MIKKAGTGSFNIKDPEAHRLHKADAEALAADLRAIAERASAHIHRPYLEHAQSLYDDHGLPK